MKDTTEIWIRFPPYVFCYETNTKTTKLPELMSSVHSSLCIPTVSYHLSHFMCMKT